MQESIGYLNNINTILTYLLPCRLTTYKLYCILALSEEDIKDLCGTIRMVNREKDSRVINDFERIVNKTKNKLANTSNLKPNAYIYFADYLEEYSHFDMLIKLINYNIMEMYNNIINKNIVYNKSYCQRILVSTIEKFYKINIDESEYNKIYLERERTYRLIETHPDNYSKVDNSNNQSSTLITLPDDEPLSIINFEKLTITNNTSHSSKNSVVSDFELIEDIEDDMPTHEAELY